MSAQLAIFLFQRGQRLLEIAGVINRDLQRQHARAQVGPTTPIPIVRADPPQLKIGFIAHTRQIKGCCRQHLLAGNFSALPPSPASVREDPPAAAPAGTAPDNNASGAVAKTRRYRRWRHTPRLTARLRQR